MRSSRLVPLLLALACGETDPAIVAGTRQVALLPTLVETTSGTLQGTVSQGRVVFRNIPYAAPPVGPLRFLPPQPAAPWDGVRDASRFGARCPQLTPTGAVTGSEDCLTLNVYTPADGAGAALPVIVWIHGGGNRSTSAQELQFDNSTLPARGVVLVTIQFRLGALGWFAYPELPEAGSNGLLDQIAALRWVQDNIARFGGDPTRVTVGGQSGGGRDIIALLAAPAARGLFSRAVVQSIALFADSLETSQAHGLSIETKVGCAGDPDAVACLRSRSAAELVPAIPSNVNFIGLASQLAPVVDGVALLEHPIDKIRREGAGVPLIVGSLSDEWQFFNVPATLTADAYAAAVKSTVGDERGDRFLALYPASSYATPREAYMAWATDYGMACPARYLSRVAHGDGRPPVWRYVFSNRLDNNATLAAQGAFHTQDVFFVMGVLSLFRNIAYTPTPGEVSLSARMQDLWTRFAATGDPDPPDGTVWHRYSPGREWYLRLDEEIAGGARWHSELCDAWDEAPDLWGRVL